MRLHKTPKAREMLTRNGPELSQIERRILILCDGRRDPASLLRMLGPQAQASIEVLLQQQYLHASATPCSQTPPTGVTPAPEGRAADLVRGFGRFLSGRDGKPDAAAVDSGVASGSPPVRTSAVPSTAPMAAATMPSSSPAPTAGQRRSLSAAKMYMLDMLQLQRSMEAASIAVTIQTSSGDDALVAALLEGLAHLASVTRPSMAMRVAERLTEVLPRPYPDAVARCWATLQPQAGPAAGNNVIPIERRA